MAKQYKIKDLAIILGRISDELFDLDAAILQFAGSDDLPDDDSSLGATIRQSAILEKIRAGSSQIKDLMVSFPDVSERTLRYDLHKLHNQGLINRVGNGPNTSYTVSPK